jgi:hypothetical protein
MANILGSLFVELKANTASFVEGMSKAAHSSKQTANDIKGAFASIRGAVGESLGEFGRFGSVIAGLGSAAGGLFDSFDKGRGSMSLAIGVVGGFAAAGVAAAGGLSALAIEGAELVERLSLISQKTGISIHDLQAFQAAGKTVGVSLEDMVTAMRKFDQGIVGAGKGAGAAQLVMKQLGVTSRDNKEALLQVADAFAKMPDGANKAADAVLLFGRSGLTMIPLLNKGRAGIQEFNDIVDIYGPKIGRDAVKANEDFLVSQLKLNLAFDSFKVSVAQALLPAISEALTGMANLAHDTGKVVEQFSTLSGAWNGLKQAGKFWTGGGGKALDVELPTVGDDGAAAKAKARQDAVDALTQKQKELFQAIKAGSAEAYALEQKREQIAEAVAAGQFQIAANLQSQIPALEAAVKLEKERQAAAARHLESLKGIAAAEAAMATGGSKPLFKWRGFQGHTTPEAPTAPETTLEAPTTSPITDLFNAGKPKGIDVAKAAIEEMYKSWGAEAKKTEEDVNETYDGQLQKLQGYLALGEISQKQFSDASIALEKARALGIEDVWRNSSGFGDQFKNLFVQIKNSGSDVVKSFFADLSGAVEGLNSQLAKLVVTGKANFTQLRKGFEESLIQTGLKKTESLAVGGIEKLFGIGGGGKAGDSPTNPIYAAIVPGIGGIGALTGGAGGSAGGILGTVMKLFGGGMAGGGDVSPGKWYVVGEKHPEFFSPKQPGQVAPSLKMSGAPQVTQLAFHVHGVTDADSFKRSKTQIMAELTAQMSAAYSRNR